MVNYKFLNYHLQFSKNYGNPTHVTRLKVAPSMADPTSMKHSVSNLKVVLALGLYISNHWVMPHPGHTLFLIPLIVLTPLPLTQMKDRSIPSPSVLTLWAAQA